MKLNKKFWRNKNVFITGHTGFKGGWLCSLLNILHSNITGYSLKAPTNQIYLGRQSKSLLKRF